LKNNRRRQRGLLRYTGNVFMLQRWRGLND
jgi:hypothetical protein